MTFHINEVIWSKVAKITFKPLDIDQDIFVKRLSADVCYDLSTWGGGLGGVWLTVEGRVEFVSVGGLGTVLWVWVGWVGWLRKEWNFGVCVGGAGLSCLLEKT